MLEGKKIAVLGVGKIGEAIIRALIDRGGVRGPDMTGTAARDESVARIERLGIKAAATNTDAARGADIILIAVKPTVVPQVCADIAPVIAKGALVVSIAASVTTKTLESALGAGVPVVRVMPNTPCLLGEGMSVLARGSVAKDEHLRLARALFDAVGRTAVLDEKLMDGVTGLSGSGPAYVYVVIESLAEAGVKVGIPRDVSTLLAAQTVLGAARMVLELGEHPALLKDAVTTPAGCTVDGLLELEEGGLRVTLIKAVMRATERARELAPPPETK